MNSKLLMVVFSLLMSGILMGVSAQELDVYASGRVESIEIESKYFDFDRKVFISLPMGYDTMTADEYDVIYIFDAQFSAQYYLATGYTDFIGEPLSRQFITVGICSPQIEAYNRNNDFLPNDSTTISQFDGAAGKSEQLALFVKEELQPYINSNFRTTGRSIGVGHSNGASFIIQGLLGHDLFDDYLALSPNFLFGNRYLAQKFIDHDFFKLTRPTFLFISHASEGKKWIAATEKVHQYIEAGNLPQNILTVYKTFPENGHWDCYPIALQSAYSEYFSYRDSIDLLKSDTEYPKHIEIIVNKGEEETYALVGKDSSSLLKMNEVNDTIRSIDLSLKLPSEIQFFRRNDPEPLWVNNSIRGRLVIRNKHKTEYRADVKE